MIYTVTLNPSLDYMMVIDTLALGEVNRSSYEMIFPGGKGINVSIILKSLGIESIPLGFCAGFTGETLEQILKDKGIIPRFIELREGMTRINVKIKGHTETEINGGGPSIEGADLEKLYQFIEQLEAEDLLVLAGSIPASLPNHMYEALMKKVKTKGVEVVVDATKELLMNVIPLGPFLIKPNHHELGELFGVTINSQDEVIQYAKKLQDKGAKNILISMAGDGAVLLTEEGQVYKHTGVKGQVRNSVGAGDSMVAGFIAGYSKHKDYKEAFKMGIAAGTATAFAEDLATKEEIEAIYHQLTI